MSHSNGSILNFSPILHEQSAEYYWKGTGGLSIKTFRGGRALYQAGHGHFAVGEDRYLLLNQGQEYSITIESDRPVESFCVFFPEGMVQEVRRSLMLPADELLDEPFYPVVQEIDFVVKTYETSPELSQVMRQMRMDSLQKLQDRTRVEEQLHALAYDLLLEQKQVEREIVQLHSIKSSTRQELYRRVHVGYEYLCAYFNQSISITEAAEAACLSTNHFLRSFKQLFGFTPHQLLKEKRLQEAGKLLQRTELPVTEICLEVGFQSLGSFSSLFTQRFGVSPSGYRGKCKR